jgi:type II secretory pathway component PulJ
MIALNIRRSRRGFTTLELLVSIPTAATLVGCLTMCIAIMGVSHRQTTKATDKLWHVTEVTNQIARDLETALAISSYSDHHIEFLVADRNGDHLPERLRYSWDSELQQILWQFNDTATEILAEQISDFRLTVQPTPALPQPDNHQLSQTTLLHALDAPEDTTIEEWPIDPNQPIAQFFVPWLPANSSHWDLGSIKIQLRALLPGHPGQLRIALHRGDSLRPTDLLGQWLIPIRRLTGDFQWFELPVGSVGQLRDLSGNQPLCIVLSQVGGSQPAVAVQAVYQAGNIGMSRRLLSNTSGSTWVSLPNGLGFRFYALGFQDNRPSRQLAERVELSFQGPAPQPPTERSIPLRNRPELL